MLPPEEEEFALSYPYHPWLPPMSGRGYRHSVREVWVRGKLYRRAAVCGAEWLRDIRTPTDKHLPLCGQCAEYWRRHGFPDAALPVEWTIVT